MEHMSKRLDFVPIVDRPKLSLPDGARLALWVIVNVEQWSITRAMPRMVLPPPMGQPMLPDVPNWSWHEYGNRVGFWRIFEALNSRNIPVTFAVNGVVCEAYSRIAEAAPAAAAQEDYAQLIAEAKKLEKKGRRRQAFELYEQALVLNPNGSEALSRLAFHYLNKGKNELAVDHASRALAADPQSSEAWIVLGAAKDALKDKTGAREAYQQCVQVGKGVYVQECKRMLR